LVDLAFKPNSYWEVKDIRVSLKLQTKEDLEIEDPKYSTLGGNNKVCFQAGLREFLARKPRLAQGCALSKEKANPINSPSFVTKQAALFHVRWVSRNDLHRPAVSWRHSDRRPNLLS